MENLSLYLMQIKKFLRLKGIEQQETHSCLKVSYYFLEGQRIKVFNALKMVVLLMTRNSKWNRTYQGHAAEVPLWVNVADGSGSRGH